MNKEIISQGLMYLKYTFPNAFSNFTESDIESMVTIWLSNFQEDKPKSFKLAIGRLAQKSKWCPTIAEIKQEIAVIENPILQLNAEQEWANVLLVVRKYGSYEPKKALECLNPYTSEIVELIGYNRLCMSENINYEKRFKEYNVDLDDSFLAATCYSAVNAAYQFNAKAIICATNNGLTAFNLSAYHPVCPIIAITVNEKACRQLNLCWDVHPIYAEKKESIDELFEYAIETSLHVSCDIMTFFLELARHMIQLYTLFSHTTNI